MLESRTFRIWFAGILLMGVFCGQAPRAQEKPSSNSLALQPYRIRIGDHIKVAVDQRPDLFKSWFVVDRNGHITLVNANAVRGSGVSVVDFEPSAFIVVKASGLSIVDFVDLLKKKLELIIPNPGLIVTLGPSSGRDPLQPTRDELPQEPSPELRQDCCDAQKSLSRPSLRPS